MGFYFIGPVGHGAGKGALGQCSSFICPALRLQGLDLLIDGSGQVVVLLVELAAGIDGGFTQRLEVLHHAVQAGSRGLGHGHGGSGGLGNHCI